MSTVVAKNLAVQNSAGTASTNISFDGTKLVSTALDNSITATANLHDLGVGQTWQDVTASRAAGVTYTNSTGKPIMVAMRYSVLSGHSSQVSPNGSVWIQLSSSSSGAGVNASFIVPDGWSYKTSGAIAQWLELR